MSVTLGLEFQASDLLAMSKAAGATEKQARRATDRALRKLGRHVASQSRAAAARKLGIAQNRLKRRYRVSCDEGVLQVWVGTYDIDPTNLGSPRQSRAGVRIGRLPLFAGAFVARMPTGHVGVYIRRSSAHYDPHRYGVTKRAPGKGGRLPIAPARLVVADAVEESFAGRDNDHADYYRRAFAHELYIQQNIVRGGQ